MLISYSCHVSFSTPYEPVNSLYLTSSKLSFSRTHDALSAAHIFKPLKLMSVLDFNPSPETLETLSAPKLANNQNRTSTILYRVESFSHVHYGTQIHLQSIPFRPQLLWSRLIEIFIRIPSSPSKNPAPHQSSVLNSNPSVTPQYTNTLAVMASWVTCTMVPGLLCSSAQTKTHYHISTK